MMVRSGERVAIQDVAAYSPDLSHYAFIAAGSSATLVGIYVDIGGRRAGTSVSITIGTSPVTFPAIPGNAVGFLGDLSAPVRYDLGAETGDADFAANPANYPTLPAGSSIAFGRISL